MGQLTFAEHAQAGLRLDKLRGAWRELQPTEALRAQAELYLQQSPLKAADALQLAAASVWCSGRKKKCTFISGDAQLLEAATQAGFPVVAA